MFFHCRTHNVLVVSRLQFNFFGCWATIILLNCFSIVEHTMCWSQDYNLIFLFWQQVRSGLERTFWSWTHVLVLFGPIFFFFGWATTIIILIFFHCRTHNVLVVPRLQFNFFVWTTINCFLNTTLTTPTTKHNVFQLCSTKKKTDNNNKDFLN